MKWKQIYAFHKKIIFEVRIFMNIIQHPNKLEEKKQHGTIYFPCAAYQSNYNSAPLSVAYHWHPQIEIIHLKKGDFLLTVNMEELRLEEECFCFINPHELHELHSKGDCLESALVFDSNMLSFELYDIIQQLLIRPIANGQLHFPRLVFANTPPGHAIANEYQLILNQFPLVDSSHYLSKALQIKISLLKIFSILEKHELLIQQQETIVDYRIEYIKTILQYIKLHYAEKISLAILAQQIGMNEQYFCRFFKKILGNSPMEYVNEYRLTKAKELLSETDKQILDVTMECGFHNMGNFIRIFKLYTGFSPSAYRKKYKKS